MLGEWQSPKQCGLSKDRNHQNASWFAGTSEETPDSKIKDGEHFNHRPEIQLSDKIFLEHQWRHGKKKKKTKTKSPHQNKKSPQTNKNIKNRLNGFRSYAAFHPESSPSLPQSYKASKRAKSISYASCKVKPQSNRAGGGGNSELLTSLTDAGLASSLCKGGKKNREEKLQKAMQTYLKG